MIKRLVDRFMEKRPELQAVFAEAHPENYSAIIKAVISILSDGYGSPDPERIHEIDDGEYQGTLVYVIAATGYQPSDYWYVMVNYGSCSGCDTLKSIRNYAEHKPSDEQVRDYMTLALHIAQNIRAMNDTEEYDPGEQD